MRDVLASRNAEQFFEEAREQLKLTSNDRSQDVRRALVDVVEYWLQHMDINELKVFEKDLVLFLLNGISDEQAPISEKSI